MRTLYYNVRQCATVTFGCTQYAVKGSAVRYGVSVRSALFLTYGYDDVVPAIVTLRQIGEHSIILLRRLPFQIEGRSIALLRNSDAHATKKPPLASIVSVFVVYRCPCGVMYR
jgi:hypothetical protein